MQQTNSIRFGISAKLTTAFVGLAALATVAGVSSSWFSLQSAEIVDNIGSRSLPAVTSALAFAQRNEALLFDAPALATQPDLAALDEKARSLERILADQERRLQDLRGMVSEPEILDSIAKSSQAFKPKLAALRTAAAKRITVRADVRKSVDDALTRFQALKNALVARQASPQGASDQNSPLLRSTGDLEAAVNLAFGTMVAAATASDTRLVAIRSLYDRGAKDARAAIERLSRNDPLVLLASAIVDAGKAANGVFALRALLAQTDAQISDMLNDLTVSSVIEAVDVKLMVAKEKNRAEMAMVRSTAVTRQTLAVNAVASGLVVVLALLIGLLYVRRAISRRLADLAQAMTRLAGGDHGAVAAVGGRDEIAAMASTVQVFRDSMIRNAELARQTTRMEEEREATRAQSDEERATAAKRQTLVVRSLADGLAGMAQGDLTGDLTQPFAAEYEDLRRDFNGTMSQLRAVMQQIIGDADALRSGMAEIAEAADDLSHRTENQAAGLEETAAALNEVTGAISSTVKHAGRAEAVVFETQKKAESSGAVMTEAVAAMAAIEASSSKIDMITGVIDEIAFQTNLLALNAGVEAARAGEAGRGFAVVAQEVRGLAQRSAEAAKEIKSLVLVSQAQVSEGVHLVQKGGTSLAGILTQIDEVKGIVSTIAQAGNHQLQGLEHANTAVGNMSHITQQNAAMVEETTAASHALTTRIHDLAEKIGRFRVGGQPARAGVVRSIASAPQRSVSRLSGGGAQRKPAPAAEPQESWAGF